MPIIPSLPYTFINGTVADATQVNADFSAVLTGVNTNAAHSGANSDITSLTALTSIATVTATVSSTLSVTGVATFASDILMTGTGELDLPSGTTAQRSGSPNTGMIRYNTTTNSFEGYGGVSAGWGSFGAGSGFPTVSTLKIFNNAGTPNTKVDITATSVQMVSNVTGAGLVRSSASVTINAASTGANGLDVGSLAASTWYYVWLIDNGTAPAGILSLSSTAPTLPSGYTFLCRCGAVRTDGSSIFLRTKQVGAVAQYTPVAATNTPSFPTMASSTSTISVSNFIPPTASIIRALLSAGSGAGTNFSSLGPSTVDFVLRADGSSSVAGRFYGDIVLETTNLYLTVSGTGSASCAGWVDSVVAS